MVFCKNCQWYRGPRDVRNKTEDKQGFVWTNTSSVVLYTYPEHCMLGYSFEYKRIRAPGAKADGDVRVSMDCRSPSALLTQRVVTTAEFVSMMRLTGGKK